MEEENRAVPRRSPYIARNVLSFTTAFYFFLNPASTIFPWDFAFAFLTF